MQDANYKTLSNRIKLITTLVGASLGLVLGIFQNLPELYKLSFGNIISISVIGVILMTLIDKLHDSMTKELIELNDKLKANFEYHGLLDSPKEKFNANEMREVWPLLISCIKKEFVAINYLSSAVWNEGDGDNLVSLLGSRMKIGKFQAKRLFVIDAIGKLVEWELILKYHKDFNISAKYILKSDFISIRDEYSMHNTSFKSVNGFNVIDPDSPGIVVDWVYKYRSSTGANLKRGKATATEYVQFFNRVWDSKHCKGV